MLEQTPSLLKLRHRMAKPKLIIITRAASSNAKLSSIILSEDILTPEFSSDTTEYTATVANSVYSVTVTPVAIDSNAVIRVNGKIVTSGSVSDEISLKVGANTITVEVEAQDGTTITYRIIVTRAAGSGGSGEGRSSGDSPGGSSGGSRPSTSVTPAYSASIKTENGKELSIPVTVNKSSGIASVGIIVWYIDGNGNAVCIPNGRYDPVTSTVTFTTTHFSYYAVSFRVVDFSDVAKNAWYVKAVSFIAAREITMGTGNGNFSPNARMTRGQFIVMLMRAFEIAPDINSKDNFADAGNTWYTGYLAAARRLGISAGVGNNMFAPEKEITRQEMFSMLYNVEDHRRTSCWKFR